MVYTLNFVAKPENKVVTQQNVNWIERAEKLDKYKVRIVAKRPFPAAIEYLAGPVVIHPNEYYAKVGPQGMNEKPVGSGPYRISEHALGKLIRLERNPDYFKDSPKPQPKIDKIEIRVIPDAQTRVAEMLAGGADMIMHIAPDQAAAAAHGAAAAGRLGRDHAVRVPELQHDGERRRRRSCATSACARRSCMRSTAKR